MESEHSLVVVLVTAPDLDTAKRIASGLVESRVAACVNIIEGISSVYRWKGSVQTDDEVLLLIKTRLELIDEQLIPLVKELHPYDLPEIIALPIGKGESAYLEWILEETHPD